jgi:hypothetical protein
MCVPQGIPGVLINHGPGCASSSGRQPCVGSRAAPSPAGHAGHITQRASATTFSTITARWRGARRTTARHTSSPGSARRLVRQRLPEQVRLIRLPLLGDMSMQAQHPWADVHGEHDPPVALDTAGTRGREGGQLTVVGCLEFGGRDVARHGKEMRRQPDRGRAMATPTSARRNRWSRPSADRGEVAQRTDAGRVRSFVASGSRR